MKDEDIVSAGGALELVHQGVPFIAPLLHNYEAIAGSVWTLSSLREAAATPISSDGTLMPMDVVDYKFAITLIV